MLNVSLVASCCATRVVPGISCIGLVGLCDFEDLLLNSLVRVLIPDPSTKLVTLLVKLALV